MNFHNRVLEKYSNIKIRENPSSGSELFYADGRTDVTKLLVAFHNFSNAPKIVQNSALFTLSRIAGCTHIYHLIYFFISRSLGAHTVTISSSSSMVMSHHFQI